MAFNGDFQDDLPPPPYSSTSDSSQQYPSNEASSASLTPGSSLFASHLSVLNENLRNNRAIQASVIDQRDNEALALIIPHIETFLSSIADIHPAPLLVEATIVPEEAVEKEWALTEKDEKLRGEVRKVIKVKKHSKLESDRKGEEKSRKIEQVEQVEPDCYQGFDEWGRWDDDAAGSSSRGSALDLLWWTDEGMTRRLAKYLQPERPTMSVDRQTVKEFVAQKQAKSRWGLFQRDEPKQPQKSPPVPSAPSPVRRTTAGDLGMNVAAEEVTFRRENDMGIWESKTGWGIVLKVKIGR